MMREFEENYRNLKLNLRNEVAQSRRVKTLRELKKTSTKCTIIIIVLI